MRRRKKKRLQRTPEERARGRQATRECRARERQRLALFVVAVDDVMLGALVDRNYLSEAQLLDKRAVNKALSAFLWDRTHRKFL